MFSQDEATVLASSTSPGASSVLVNIDIVNVGQTIAIDGGADPTTSFAQQEERQVTGKSGSGPYQCTFSPALTKPHGSSAKVGRPTRPFGCIEIVPAAIQVRSFGSPSFVQSPGQPNTAKYNNPIPMRYGTGWIS